MTNKFTLTQDEYDVNFDDTREFAIDRWDTAVEVVESELTSADWKYVSENIGFDNVSQNLRKRILESRVLVSTKKALTLMQPFPRTLANLLGHFTTAIQPDDRNFNIIWGLMSLNLELSSLSQEKLARTAIWTKKLRDVLELFNRCLVGCQDWNEARYSMVDVLDSMLQIHTDSIRHLRRYPTDTEASAAWRVLDAKINNNLKSIDAAYKHVNDVTTYSLVNRDQQLQNLRDRFAPQALPDENVTFPLMMMKRKPNENFFGREDELKKIDRFLGTRDNSSLRTYTIYGRRGVGKTDLAVEYAYKRSSVFDGIFWINCETALALRLSFSEMAIRLSLPNAYKDGHHEENQLAVLKWLNTTKRRWLLIFDNAERDDILRGYWPVGACGSILITSRSFFNFTMDANRQGETVKPFTPKESRELLMKLLGPSWQDMDRKGSIISTEDIAAREILESVGGLPLAIQQVANLIKNPNVGTSQNIADTYRSFKQHRETLQVRFLGKRSDIVWSLDTLWDMVFANLSRNSRDLLSVLALLSPDGILIDLFLPKNQMALSGKLEFCKQHPNHVDTGTQSALSSVITAPPLLQAAINQLIEFNLITQEGRTIWAHRVVQEAVSFHTKDDLQEYFDSASALVFEAFPKWQNGNYMSKKEWGECEAYIPHGSHLSFMFAKHHSTGSEQTLRGSSKFIELLSNCSWYLYEISYYDLGLLLIESGKKACEHDTESIRYAALCNVAGCSYFELNKMSECRKEWEVAIRLHEEFIPEELEIATTYHNLGNLESASDNLDEAIKYYERALRIKLASGDSAASLVALTYLCLARAYFLYKKYDKAFSVLTQSEALYFRTEGADAQFMKHIHYLFGNIEFEQKSWDTAKRNYEQSLQVSLANAPIHPITAAAYYSLGCLEYERRNMESAKLWLDKALNIATLRSPARDDGTIARILWKTSQVLESNVAGEFFAEAQKMRIRAEKAMRELTSRGEGGVVIALDDDGNADADETENAWDQLVPLFFR